MTAARAGRPARRSLAVPGPAPRSRDAKTAPGRCRLRPATATPPDDRQTGPSRPAAPSCRTRPERIPRPALGPAPRRAPVPAAAAPRTPAADRAHAAWWPAAHPARPRQPQPTPPQPAQPSGDLPLSASSDDQHRCQIRSLYPPARRPRRDRPRAPPPDAPIAGRLRPLCRPSARSYLARYGSAPPATSLTDGAETVITAAEARTPR